MGTMARLDTPARKSAQSRVSAVILQQWRRGAISQTCMRCRNCSSRLSQEARRPRGTRVICSAGESSLLHVGNDVMGGRSVDHSVNRMDGETQRDGKFFMVGERQS